MGTGNPPKSRGTTISPGVRYYGPAALRPSTKYRRGGEIAKYQERGGKLYQGRFEKSPEIPKGKYIDVDKAKFQMQKAGGTPPAPGWTSPYPETPGTSLAQQYAAGTLKPPPKQESIDPTQAGPQEQSLQIQTGFEGLYGNVKETLKGVATLGGRAPAWIIPGAFGVGTVAGFVMGLMGIGNVIPKELLYGEMMLTPTTGAAELLATKGAGVIGSNAVNPATVGLTAKIIGAVGITLAGAFAATSILGTYPFSKFISPEEATQTLDFGYRAAMDAGNHELALEALQEKVKILEGLETISDKEGRKPDFISEEDWKKVPIANIMIAVKEYVRAQRITTRAQIDLVKKTLAGTDKWSLLRQEEMEQDMLDRADYQASQRELQQMKDDAIARHDAAEKAEWTRRMAEYAKIEEEKREYNKKYWEEIRKAKADNQRSQLGFGLLG